MVVVAVVAGSVDCTTIRLGVFAETAYGFTAVVWLAADTGNGTDETLYRPPKPPITEIDRT